MKTPLEIHLPGYVCYRKKSDSSHRGGSALLIRDALAKQVTQVRIPSAECILVSLKCLPNTTIATCYIPPNDSPYHSFGPIAEIQAEMTRNPEQKIIVIGDLNARFGNERKGFLEEKYLPPQTKYTAQCDDVRKPNSNARYIQSALKELILLNGLSTDNKELSGALTFRKGPRWISELDSCLVSPTLLPFIEKFEINHSLQIPSDHAPISLNLGTEKHPELANTTLQAILGRSRDLGIIQEDRIVPTTRPTKRPIRMESIDAPRAREFLMRCNPPAIPSDNNLDHSTAEVNAILYTCAETCQKRTTESPPTSTEQRRWKELLESNDSKLLWKAINWNGCLKDDSREEMPTDDEFRNHFEALLNPPATQPIIVPESTYLPATDDPITPLEVDRAIRSLRPKKSGGPSGVPPGLLKVLPGNWIAFLASLFSAIMYSSSYPTTWTYTKLVTIFKKGARLSCDNYRGIALMDSLAKLYDIVMNSRLNLWFQPDREQAGAQKGRSCLEHLLTLRLLIDSARHKRRKLYVVFVDFSKAYDRVPRATMLNMMKDLGCGTVMMRAIAAAYKSTQMILRTAVVTSTVGVRQGSPTSCLLFTVLVNQLIRDFKEQCPPDGFLHQLHCLMLMDDAVILATTKESALRKLKVLETFCSKSGMIINEAKTKFMIVNGADKVHEPLKSDQLTVMNCTKYTYLGAVITQDASIVTSVKAQCEAKRAHIVKFEAYVRKNASMPFPGKKKVFDAALTSAILYSCETWLSAAAIAVASPMYAACVKTLLGVRKTTATDLCLVEAGIPSLLHYVRSAQKNCIMKLIKERATLPDDPFNLALRIAQEARCPTARYISTLERFNPEEESTALLDRVQQSERSKFVTYVQTMNPSLTVHDMYSRLDTIESHRLSATRLRLSSHNLAIERGRWSRQPRDERLCSCGAIQDEEHVSARCPRTQHVRANHQQIDFTLPALFNVTPVQDMLTVVHRLFSEFV